MRMSRTLGRRGLLRFSKTARLQGFPKRRSLALGRRGGGFELPERVPPAQEWVLARPTGVGRALATYDLPIEGRDEWLAAIPEFIPVLGPLDYVVVAVVAMRYVRRRVGIADLSRRWAGTPEGFALLSRLIGTD